MSSYTKSTDFASKDALLTGNPLKVIKGTEIDDEYNAIQTAINSKADTNSPDLTGTPTAPTAATGTNTTQIASTAFVNNQIASDLADSPDLGGTPTAPTASAGTNTTQIATTEFVITNAALPSGAVMPFAMPTPPTGWLLCNGQAVSRTTYASLFAAIGLTYGVGDASTTFNLPDLRGEFLRGLDLSRGVDSGRTNGSFQDQETRWYKAAANGANSTNFYNNGPYDGQFAGKDVDSSSTQMDRTIYNWDTSYETRPRNVAMAYCIKI